MIGSRSLSTAADSRWGFLSCVTPTELKASPPWMRLSRRTWSERCHSDDHRCSLLTWQSWYSRRSHPSAWELSLTQKQRKLSIYCCLEKKAVQTTYWTCWGLVCCHLSNWESLERGVHNLYRQVCSFFHWFCESSCSWFESYIYDIYVYTYIYLHICMLEN